MPIVRPRVLFITPAVPDPTGSGWEKRAWSHLQAFAEIAEVHLLVALIPAQFQRPFDTGELRDLTHALSCVRLEPTWKLHESDIPGMTLLVRLLAWSGPAYQLAVARHPELIPEVAAFDVVFCFRLRAYTVWTQLARRYRGADPRVFVDFDDIESLTLKREYEQLQSAWGLEYRLMQRLDILITRRLESRVLRKVHSVSVCSEIDQRRLQARGARAAEVVVIPNSHPLLPALPWHEVGHTGKLLFLGTISFKPNEDAVLYFVRQVLPTIRMLSRRPIVLKVVGRNPSSSVCALGTEPYIEVTGAVDDVKPYYEWCDLVIVPIRYGGGTRIKILEALSFGKPVVSTSLGAEGIDLVPGSEIALADEPADFAATCVRLLNDERWRYALASAGREKIADVYESKRVHALLRSALRLGTTNGHSAEQ